MTRSMQLLGAASVLAVASLGVSPAFAAGTTAGSTITNTVTLNYQVGGVAQNAVTTADSFIVDRKVNLTVAEVGNATTSVSPGQTSAVTSFDVTNTSNAPLDFALAVTQQDGGPATHGGTDNFDATNVRIYLDDGDGSYDGGDTLITYLDEIAADASARVFVLVDIPLGRSTNDVAEVRLTATAAEAAAAGSLGATVVQTGGANGNNTMETVFADTNANGNTARDGADFDEDDYTVLAAAVTATKTSRIISDPFNNTTDPKMIPGAVVEYCIAIANSGGATATNVAISDALPATTTFESGFGILVNGTVTGAVCNADGSAGGSHAAGTVTASLSDIASGVTRTVLFRVSVN